jgi:DNA repair protein RecO (recombination protein O)
MTGSTRRVQLEPGFLLHHYPWRDSSRILEVLTRSHGRVALFARAVRRSGSALPAALQPFGELLVSWSGRGEAVRLTAVERSAGAYAALTGDRLMSGFYANELLIRLLPRNDSHPELFAAYAALLAGLADTGTPAARALRIFEKRLLESLGYGLSLEAETGSGRRLEPSRSYRYRLDAGAEAIDGVAEGSLIFCGASLLSLAGEELDDARSLADARRLLRAALDQCLDGRELRTREVVRAMRAHATHERG